MIVSPIKSPIYSVISATIGGDADSEATYTLRLDYRHNEYEQGIWDFGGSLMLDYARESYVQEDTLWYDFDWTLSLDYSRNSYRLNA